MYRFNFLVRGFGIILLKSLRKNIVITLISGDGPRGERYIRISDFVQCDYIVEASGIYYSLQVK